MSAANLCTGALNVEVSSNANMAWLSVAVRKATTIPRMSAFSPPWPALPRPADDRSDADPALLQASADEAELWARRVKLLEAGLLKVCRFHVVKVAGWEEAALGQAALRVH